MDSSILQVLRSSSFSELIKLKTQLDDIIKEKKIENLALLPSNFVDVHSDFVDKNSDNYQKIVSELQSMDFKNSNKAETIWLTSTGEQYVWMSSSGHSTVKKPVDIGEYPGISALMDVINTKFGCKLNSCLASSYSTGSSATRYHSDDESSLDSTQGIYVVSFGAKRTIDILQAAANKASNSDFFVEATDCSLYIMKPGCQENFVHKVRSASSVKDRRFSLSFRCMVTQKQTATSSEINESVTLETPAIESPATPEATITTTTTTTTATSESGGSAAHTVAPVYYRLVPRQPKKRKTTVLFGTSMTKYVREKQLGFRGRKVINISHSGAKIKDISLNVREFYSTHQAALSDDVEKIIFSFGTNDIKYSKFGVRHLKKLIDELVDMTKCLFPAAIVLFQCCLPIRCMYPYIARNVVDFNNMLREICFINNCVFIDCFSSFLTRDLKFCNKDLYHDWLHLNNRGVGVLCTWLKFVVNENSFDRIVNNLIGL